MQTFAPQISEHGQVQLEPCQNQSDDLTAHVIEGQGCRLRIERCLCCFKILSDRPDERQPIRIEILLW